MPWGIPTDDTSPFADEPSYEDLKNLAAALELVTDQQAEENASLREQVRLLEARLADLEERLGRNPRNSSMPPSAELFTKPPSPSRAEWRAAAKKQGKQPGAPGKHLAQRTDPDVIVTHSPDVCGSCGD